MSSNPSGSSSGGGNDKSEIVINKKFFKRGRQQRRDATEAGGKQKGSPAYQHPNKYHKNIRALTVFNCPVCDGRSTVHVRFDSKNKKAVVECSHCAGVRPRPDDLPYPYTEPYVSRQLKNKADVFFSFLDKYQKLMAASGITEQRVVSRQQQQQGGASAEAGQAARETALDMDAIMGASGSDLDDYVNGSSGHDEHEGDEEEGSESQTNGAATTGAVAGEGGSSGEAQRTAAVAAPAQSGTSGDAIDDVDNAIDFFNEDL